MSANRIICRYEPGLFPKNEFLKDDQGNLVFPHLHIVKIPFHFANGKLIPPNSYPGGNPPGGIHPPDLPNIPSLYIPITPAISDSFNDELKRFMNSHKDISLQKMLDFGKRLGLETKKLDLRNLIELNLREMPENVLEDLERFIKDYKKPPFSGIDLPSIGEDKPNPGFDKNDFGDFWNSGGIGGGKGGLK